MQFEDALRAQLLAKPNLNAKERQVLAIIESRPSKRRTRKLHRMENHARASLDIAPTTAAIDWDKIDWGKAFIKIMEVLIKLLPLLMLL